MRVPACKCCPHISTADIAADELLYEVWEYCPDSECLVSYCDACRSNALRGPTGGLGERERRIRDAAVAVSDMLAWGYVPE